MSELADKFKASGLLNLADEVSQVIDPNLPMSGHSSIADLYQSGIDNLGAVFVELFPHQYSFKNFLQSKKVAESGGKGINRDTAKSSRVAGKTYEKHFVSEDEAISAIQDGLEWLKAKKLKKSKTAASQYPFPFRALHSRLNGKILGIEKGLYFKTKDGKRELDLEAIKANDNLQAALEEVELLIQARQFLKEAAEKVYEELRTPQDSPLPRKEYLEEFYPRFRNELHKSKSKKSKQLLAKIKNCYNNDPSWDFPDTYSAKDWKPKKK